MNRDQFFNLDVEVEVLAIALNDVKALDRVIELSENDFYNTKHRVLFAGIKSMWIDNKAITLTTILNMFKSDLQAVGGVSYVTEIECSYTSSRALKDLLDTLKAYSKRRDIFNMKVKIEKMLKDEKQNEEILENINNDLLVISNENNGDDGDVDAAVEELMNVLEEKFVNGGKVTGIQTKLQGLDKRLNGLNKQEMIIIAGRPGSGKTTLANNIGIRAAAQGKHVAIFNLEMSKIQIFQKLLSNVALINNETLKFGNLNEQDWQKAADGQMKLSKLGKNMKVYDSILSIDGIIAQSRKLHRKGKLDLVIIDYLQLIEINAKKNSREQEVSTMSRRLKQLSKELNVPVVVLSQLSRSCEQRVDKRPLPSDLRESGAIEQDADVVLFCYRDEYYNADTEDKNILEIIVGKNRNGANGTEKVAWIPQYQKVSDLDLRR